VAYVSLNVSLFW